MIAPSTGGSCYLSVTPSPTYSAICYIWECLAAESSFGQTVGHAYPSLTYGRFQRGGLTFQWQLGRCLQIADLHRECRLIPSLDLNLPVRGPPALVIRQRNMYTAEASAIGRKPPSSSRVGIGGNVPLLVIRDARRAYECMASFSEYDSDWERPLCRRLPISQTYVANVRYSNTVDQNRTDGIRPSIGHCRFWIIRLPLPMDRAILRGAGDPRPDWVQRIAWLAPSSAATFIIPIAACFDAQ